MGEMDYLLEEEKANTEPATEDSLARIADLAQRFKAKKAEIETLNDQLKEYKAEFNKLSMELIPESLLAVGMSAFTLASGESVSFKDEISVSVKDYNKFYNFLEERGDSAIMKIKLEIGKVPKEILYKILQKLNETFGILAEPSMFVHPMTLKKYVKELCGVGKNNVGEMPIAAIDEDMLKIFPFYKTTVK